MRRDYSLPEFERMSLVMAIIMLAYASARFVEIPSQTINLDFAGLFLSLRVNLNTITSVMVALLAAAGTDWILHDGRNELADRLQHWMIPALTAWILSLPLANLPLSVDWWLIFSGGAVLLSFVLIAEYISQRNEHRYYSIASVGLLALSYALFLMLGINLEALEIRLVLILPTLFAAAALISLRVQMLSQEGKWSLVPIVGLAFLTTQIGAALHYWPLSPLSFAFLLLGVMYSLNNLLSALKKEKLARQVLIENGLILLVFVILALLLP
mgnify:CR=1 FL=1